MFTAPTDLAPENHVDLSGADLDQPIYRIYPFDRFLGMLASQRNTLVTPAKWEDPFESFFLRRTEIVDDVSGTAMTLENLSEDWYGQCWSLHSETDAMWRIYSQNPKTTSGVKVRTTIRRLLDNLRRARTAHPDYLQFWIGKVAYVSEAEIRAYMAKLTLNALTFGGQGHEMARLLCVKRDHFVHEREVRLLFYDHHPKQGAGGLFHYQLDPHAVFDEVVLDPRLETATFSQLEEKLKTAGCRLPIRRSSLYEVPRFVIPFI